MELATVRTSGTDWSLKASRWRERPGRRLGFEVEDLGVMGKGTEVALSGAVDGSEVSVGYFCVERCCKDWPWSSPSPWPADGASGAGLEA